MDIVGKYEQVQHECIPQAILGTDVLCQAKPTASVGQTRHRDDKTVDCGPQYSIYSIRIASAVLVRPHWPQFMKCEVRHGKDRRFRACVLAADWFLWEGWGLPEATVGHKDWHRHGCSHQMDHVSGIAGIFFMSISYSKNISCSWSAVDILQCWIAEAVRTLVVCHTRELAYQVQQGRAELESINNR